MSAPDDLAGAEALVEAGNLDGARAAAERALAADPGSAPARNVLGFIAYREGRLIEAQREFEHAAALDAGDEDARANLDAIRRELAAVYASHATEEAAPAPLAPAPAHAPAPATPEPDFVASYDDLRSWVFGPDISTRLLGRLLGAPVQDGLHRRLDQIPTATTIDERRFLLRYAAQFWDGQGDVFENGPLLGGTTRALALGMLANANRRPGAVLHTHDWFSSRVPLDLPPGTFQQMAANGLVSARLVQEMEASGSFQALYDSLHAGHDYSPLVHSHEAYLPGHRDDVPGHGEQVFEPPPDATFSLVFVDGCKSWYGTRYWIERMCDRMAPGTHLIFQDYGWYSCFWLPVLVGVLEEHFRLVAHVDDTYAFELLRPLDVEVVRSRFPDEPQDFGREAFDKLFSTLLVDAGVRSDNHSMVAQTIQHAAALAYIGHKDEARSRIAAMRGRPELAQFRTRFVESALRSPTYTPEGPVTL